MIVNEGMLKPGRNFFQLQVELNNGSLLSLGSLKGRKILLVNTASNCGYTNQYAELQQLHENYKDRISIIGFPSNDFKQQEKGSDEEIASFCKANFGVSFPLAKKSTVIKADGQHEVFHWLSNKSENGWLNKQPSWNFSKYIVNEEGILTHYFDPSISPVSKKFLKALSL